MRPSRNLKTLQKRPPGVSPPAYVWHKTDLLAAAPRLWCPAAASDSRFYELQVQRDGDFLPNQDAARFQRRIPGQTVVFAVDLCRRRDANPGIAPRIFGRRCRALHGEPHSTGDSMNGQFAFNCVLVLVL